MRSSTHCIRASTSILLAAVILLTGRPLAAQSIPDRPACASCAFELKAVATLGTADGPGYLRDSFNQITTDRDGRYWVFDSEEPPRVFAANGSFITAIGRKGEGPGEFRHMSWYFAVPGDSVAVVEMTGKAHMISRDLRVTRTWMMAPGAWGAHVIRWPDSVVINAARVGWGELGPSLHLVSARETGERLIRSLGYATYVRPTSNGGYSAHRQFLIPRAGGEFWTLDAGRYKWRRWTRSGTAIDSLERHPSWFPGESEGRIGTPTSPPDPRVFGGTVDEQGRLWTYIHAPVADYERAWRRKDLPSRGEISMKAFDIDAMFTTIVEVIDPVSRRVIARSSFDRPIKEVLPGNRIVFYSMNGDIPQANVYSIALLTR